MAKLIKKMKRDFCREKAALRIIDRIVFNTKPSYFLVDSSPICSFELMNPKQRQAFS